MLKQNIPILRIFDVQKAKEFYIDWLGFEIEFEHQFEPDTPYYIGIKREDIRFHLSEHHGDSVPGVRIFIICTELKQFFEELQSRPYKYYRPSLQETFYGTWQVHIQDPFGNGLSFNEYKDPELNN
ncbi:MAG TPA: glyoxalase superfamily protein [Chitinophagaceae bacterium]|nr:glyoxalase superfamily protein [Chitinophagaceae bacterium]